MSTLSDLHPITQAMAKALFASAYAEAYDEARQEGIDPGFSPSGCDWMDLVPSDMDQGAIRSALRLEHDLLCSNGCYIDTLYEWVERLLEEYDGGDRELSEDMLGHYLAMQWMGHGVGLEDAFGSAVHDTINVPYGDFSSCDLDKDYFNVDDDEQD